MVYDILFLYILLQQKQTQRGIMPVKKTSTLLEQKQISYMCDQSVNISLLGT